MSPPKEHISDHCLGVPRSVNTSHSGNIDLAISLQEPVVFLPWQRRENLFGRRRPAGHDHNSASSSQGRSRSNSNARRDSPAARSNPASNAASTSSSPGPPSEGAESGSTGWGHGWGGHGSGGGSGAANGDGGDGDELPSFDEINGTSPGALLRGSIVLKLSKATKIKQLSLVFYTVSRTAWNLVPQPTVLVDAPLPSSAELEDVAYLAQHYWDFVPADMCRQPQAGLAKFDQSAMLVGQDAHGADTAIYRDSGELRHRKTLEVKTSPATRTVNGLPVYSPLQEPVRKVRYPPINSDGVTYPPGEYCFHFSLLVDAACPETIMVPNGYVKHFLAARVVRPGAFAPNVTGKLEIEMVRSPPTESDGSTNPQGVVLSRVWDDRLVYSVNLEQRHMTLDMPARLSISLMPLPGRNIMVHQVRVYLLELVDYLFSTDYSIHTSDSSLKLVLAQINAPVNKDVDQSAQDATKVGTLLHPTEPTHINCEIMAATVSDKPIQALPQAYGRGRNGERRFLEPNMVSPYIKLKHRLVVGLRVSKMDPNDDKRCHFEVKIDTPVVLLSKYCVHDSVTLPGYGREEALPSFDDALNHEVVGAPFKISGKEATPGPAPQPPSISRGGSMSYSRPPSIGPSESVFDSDGEEVPVPITDDNASVCRVNSNIEL